MSRPYILIFCILCFAFSGFSQTTVTILEQEPSSTTTKFQYSASKHYSVAPIIYINPLTTIIRIDAPSMTSTQLVVLAGANRQKIVIYGENVANKLQIRNADATFYLGFRDRWEAEFYNNKWIETSRTDLEF